MGVGLCVGRIVIQDLSISGILNFSIFILLKNRVFKRTDFQAFTDGVSRKSIASAIEVGLSVKA